MEFNEVVEFWRQLPCLWDRLREEKRPIYLYGMGDGAEKIYGVMERFGIPLAGIFASDEYVRGHSFLGHRVQKLSEVEALEQDNFVILLAFAAFAEDLTEKIRTIAKRHPLYAPDTPVAGEILFTGDFLNQHLKDFQRVWELLADEQSQKVLRNVVAFKLTGDISWLFACETREAEVTETLIPLKELRGTLVDLGGYDGDTLRQWIRETEGKFDRILTMEPDPKNFKKLQRKMEGWDLSRVTLFQGAAHSCRDTLTFAVRGGRNSALLGTGGTRVQKTFSVTAESVDHLLPEDPVSLIKMDVEGNEGEALRGAAGAIRRCRPALMISAYHRSEDLFALPLLTETLTGGGYRYYLRHHPYIPAWETNYYAVPAEKTDCENAFSGV